MEESENKSESSESLETSEHADASLSDALKQLRRRMFYPKMMAQPDPAAGEQSEAMPPQLSEQPLAVRDEPPAIAEESSSVSVQQVSGALEELSSEIRRVGRELFKTNRTAERNQAAFESALEEIRQLAAVVEQVPAQSAESVFHAKASLCSELISVADTLEAGLAAASDALARLEQNAAQPERGIAFRFRQTRVLRARLDDSVQIMKQWLEGQQLLMERIRAALRAAGVRQIESVGRPFNPEIHRAVAVERRSDAPSGVIVAEELKGYALDNRLLRYAEVIVNKHE